MNTQKELKTENIEKSAPTETVETPYIYIYRRGIIHSSKTVTEVSSEKSETSEKQQQR